MSIQVIYFQFIIIAWLLGSRVCLKTVSMTFYWYPGTAWLQTIVWFILNYENSVEETSWKHIWDLVPMLEFTPVGQQPLLLVLEEMSSPRLMASHLPPRAFALHGNVSSKRTKIVYGLRNPKDMLVSYYHYSRLVNDGAWLSFYVVIKHGYSNRQLAPFRTLFFQVNEWWKMCLVVTYIQFQDIRVNINMFGDSSKSSAAEGDALNPLKSCTG